MIRSVTIVGSGAVGLYFGTKLKRSGLDVRFLVRSDYDHVREKGVFIHSKDEGEIHEMVKAFRTPEECAGADLVLICLKTTARDYLKDVLPRVAGPASIVMTLQNGLGNEEEIASMVSPRLIIGGVVFVCLNRIAPGEVSHTAFGYVKANGFSTDFDGAVLKEVREAFVKSGIPFDIEESLLELKWEKLIWNIPFNGLSAALGGVDTERILQHEPTMEMVRCLMEEVVLGATSQGIELSPSLIDENIQKTLKMGPYMTSMSLDRLACRALECESIIGEPLRKAETKGIDLPYMKNLYGLLSFYNKFLTR